MIMEFLNRSVVRYEPVYKESFLAFLSLYQTEWKGQPELRLLAVDFVAMLKRI